MLMLRLLSHFGLQRPVCMPLAVVMHRKAHARLILRGVRYIACNPDGMCIRLSRMCVGI